jgi:hypothetical protein
MNRRNLSGIFIFHQFEDESKRKPTCFEDCPEEKQNEWLDTLEPQALKNLSKLLAKTLREVGEFCDITKGGEE